MVRSRTLPDLLSPPAHPVAFGLGMCSVCCTAEHPEVCPKDYHLAKLTGFEIWAEGKEGDFSIELKSISAGPK